MQICQIWKAANSRTFQDLDIKFPELYGPLKRGRNSRTFKNFPGGMGTMILLPCLLGHVPLHCQGGTASAWSAKHDPTAPRGWLGRLQQSSSSVSPSCPIKLTSREAKTTHTVPQTVDCQNWKRTKENPPCPSTKLIL